jgi:hypothetical protein
MCGCITETPCTPCSRHTFKCVLTTTSTRATVHAIGADLKTCIRPASEWFAWIKGSTTSAGSAREQIWARRRVRMNATCCTRMHVNLTYQVAQCAHPGSCGNVECANERKILLTHVCLQVMSLAYKSVAACPIVASSRVLVLARPLQIHVQCASCTRHLHCFLHFVFCALCVCVCVCALLTCAYTAIAYMQ